MEKKIEIPTDDGHLIYGTLNSTAKKDRLIVLVHGLTGGRNEHQYFNAPCFFNDAFDTFRFDFYPDRKQKARLLSECSISLHAKDLDTVVDHFEGKYKIICLVGHSLGCPVILRSDLSRVSKIVLWDPTTGMGSLREKGCRYVPSLKKYLLSWGKELFISKEMVAEWKACANLKREAKRISVPCKFVFAEWGGKAAAWKLVIEGNHPYAVIPGATHVFYEEGTERLLFKETKSFLSRK